MQDEHEAMMARAATAAEMGIELGGGRTPMEKAINRLLNAAHEAIDLMDARDSCELEAAVRDELLEASLALIEEQGQEKLRARR